MQYEMQSHTVLMYMYSARYEKQNKNSTVHVVKSGNIFPQPNAGVHFWGVKVCQQICNTVIKQKLKKHLKL